MPNTVTQAAFSNQLAEELGWTKKEADNVLDTVSELIFTNLKADPTAGVSVRGIGKFTITKKAATRARKGISPFTGEETTFKAKPASVKAKVLVQKSLRDRLQKIRFPKAAA